MNQNIGQQRFNHKEHQRDQVDKGDKGKGDWQGLNKNNKVGISRR